MINLPPKIQAVVDQLLERGANVWAVGGSVRDDLLGRPIHDYDLCTDFTPDEIAGIFPDRKDAGKIFGVSIIHLGDGEFLELATLRKDGSYTDGRRPDEVIFTKDLKEDASRRDFTINAMYVDLRTGQLIDFFSGQKHLELGLLFTVGKAEDRFTEDKLRMMRAVRFASQLNLDIHSNITNAIWALQDQIKVISVERIREELLKMLTRKGIANLIGTGLADHIFPELIRMSDEPQNPIHHPEGDVLEHSIMVMELLPEDPILKFAGLLHDVGKPFCHSEDERGIHHYGHAETGAELAKQICQRLKFSNEDTSRMVWLVKNHMKAHDGKKLAEKTVVRLLKSPYAQDLIELQHADSLGAMNPDKSLREFYLEKMETDEKIKAEPLLRGKDLIDLGFKPSPFFSQVLKYVQEQQDGGLMTTKEDAFRYVNTLKAYLGART